jgi:hypothetical protein
MGKKILLIFDPNRKDLFSYLGKDKNNEYYLLFNDQKMNDLPKELGFVKEEFRWKDFVNAWAVIKRIRPDKIVFQEIFDLKQIALNVVARRKNIPTIFLDHGIWSHFFEIDQEDDKQLAQIKRSKLKKLANFFRFIKGYYFYYSGITAVRRKNIRDFLLYPFHTFIYSSVKAINKIYFEERSASKYILFAPYNFEPIKNYYHFSEETVTYAGFPYFDDYFNKEKLVKKYIVFIDHPYLEDKLLNWTHDFHKKVAENIFSIAEKTDYNVLVKLHPRSNIDNWKAYNFACERVDFVKQVTDVSFYLNAHLIMGYASTLMIGFISAKKNVVLLGWHPQPVIFGPDYSAYGVCHKSMALSDADDSFSFWLHNNLTEKDEDAYANFLATFNPQFNGEASERIIHLIGE